VVLEGPTGMFEMGRREISIIVWKILSDAQAQHGHIARCGQLAPIGQATGIFKGGAAHPQLAGAFCHLNREIDFSAPQGFRHNNRNVIGGFRDQRQYCVFQSDGLAWLKAQFRWRHAGCALGNLQPAFQ